VHNRRQPSEKMPHLLLNIQLFQGLFASWAIPFGDGVCVFCQCSRVKTALFAAIPVFFFHFSLDILPNKSYKAAKAVQI
jgi:hypothetical protein